MIFCNALMHYFLLWEVVETKLDALSFNIRRTILTFSKAEFLLITGLWHSSGAVVQERVLNRRIQRYSIEFIWWCRPTDVRFATFEDDCMKFVFLNDEDDVKVIHH